MTAPAPSAPISTSRLAHARAPGARPPAAARARGDWGARRGAWGEGRHGRGKAPDRAEEGAEHAPQPRPVPGSAEPEAASPVKWQRRGTSLHNKPAAAPGRRAGRGETGKGRGETGKGRGTRSRPRARPGKTRGGEGPTRVLRPEPGRARPEVARARTPGGGGGGRSSQRGRAGRSSNSLCPAPSLVRVSRWRGGPRAGSGRGRVSPTQ